MKILLISDLHSDQKTLPKLNLLLKKETFDLALIPGDIQNPHPNDAEYTKKLDQIFQKYDLKWFCVHGNNDPYVAIDYTRKHHLNLHFEPHEFMGYKFIGLGGWGDEFPPYDLKFDQKTIFLTHIPPKFPSSNRQPPPVNCPLVHISGHMHHWQKFYDLDLARIVNLPSVKYTATAAILEIPSKKVKFIDLPTVNFLHN